MMKKKKNNKGFSLVELIVVIAIMAVLVGVLAPQFIGYVARSKASTDMQNADSLKSAIEIAVAEADSSTAKVVVSVNAVVSGAASSEQITTAVTDCTPTLTTVNLKDSSWSAGTYEYTAADGWKKTSSNDSTTTAGGKNFTMADVFTN